MNNFQIRAFVRQLIAEAKEAKLPKSSGKLMDLKKELEALETMKMELEVAKFAEKTAETEVEFADLAKFAKELDKLKAGGVKLEQDIDNKIAELKTKIDSEKNKVKEMMGIATVPTVVDEKKKPSAGMTKKEKSAVVKKDRAGEDIGKEGDGFEEVAKVAGGGKKGQKTAAAQMGKVQAKK